MEVNVIYNGREYKGTVLYKGRTYWLINIPEIGDRKIVKRDILEADNSYKRFL